MSTDSRAAIEAVIKEYPDLTAEGFGVPRRRGSSNEAYLESVRESQARVLEDVNTFAAALEWWKKQSSIKSFYRKHSSYSLKHVVEHEVGYCYNGTFIAAAITAGFKVKRIGNMDAYLNISGKSVSRSKKAKADAEDAGFSRPYH